MNHHRALKLVLGVAMLIGIGATSTMALRAQTFQRVYGGNSCVEIGFKRVTPVLGTCIGNNDGYIAVGVSNSIGANCSTPSDVYVVRTDVNGRKVWEYTYDIGGVGGVDEGESIIELSDGTGFAVVGTTDLASITNRDIFIMKLDCDGNVVWTRTYGGTADEVGNDIFEAISGNLTTTLAGDFIVCGATRSGAGTG